MPTPHSAIGKKTAGWLWIANAGKPSVSFDSVVCGFHATSLKHKSLHDSVDCLCDGLLLHSIAIPLPYITEDAPYRRVKQRSET
jgi:hypothetical protein